MRKHIVRNWTKNYSLDVAVFANPNAKQKWPNSVSQVRYPWDIHRKNNIHRMLGRVSKCGLATNFVFGMNLQFAEDCEDLSDDTKQKRKERKHRNCSKVQFCVLAHQCADQESPHLWISKGTTSQSSWMNLAAGWRARWAAQTEMKSKGLVGKEMESMSPKKRVVKGKRRKRLKAGY